MTLCLLALASPLCAGGWFPVRIEQPIYPALAIQAQIQGVVRLSLTLSAEGEVLAAEVVSGNSILAREAKVNALAWSFAERCPNEEASPRTVEMTYEFRLNGGPEAQPKTRFRYEHPYRVLLISQPLHWTPQKAK
jgi:TonB family protein